MEKYNQEPLKELYRADNGTAVDPDLLLRLPRHTSLPADELRPIDEGDGASTPGVRVRGDVAFLFVVLDALGALTERAVKEGEGRNIVR